jgi:hypothetical protein
MWKANLKAEAVSSYQGRRKSSSSTPSSPHTLSSKSTLSSLTLASSASSSQQQQASSEINLRADIQENEVKMSGENEQDENHNKDYIPKGKVAYKCESCQDMTAYVSNRFSKRGGTKVVYRCGKCSRGWSDFFCDEGDYDFLSG